MNDRVGNDKKTIYIFASLGQTVFTAVMEESTQTFSNDHPRFIKYDKTVPNAHSTGRPVPSYLQTQRAPSKHPAGVQRHCHIQPHRSNVVNMKYQYEMAGPEEPQCK